jgi:hypothetical protein
MVCGVHTYRYIWRTSREKNYDQTNKQNFFFLKLFHVKEPNGYDKTN